ncbi:MAG: ATP-binding cassette domain-containing protein [Rhodospirillales bacterium]|jgi:peptide/nickel transport system ATP-binding protein|nr:ATP-binding cassette domain-containing protein [Rhodospirillales bacterium]
MNAEPAPLLSVRNLVKTFPLQRPFLWQPGVDLRAVDDVSFDIERGHTMGLVGESGSGKSTIGRAVTMLVPPTSGSIRFEGEEITGLTTAKLRPVRRRFQMVFQDPYASLNPRMRVGEFVAEPLVIHGLMPERGERDDYVAELFRKVGLDPAFAQRYPHQFSGGQQQRICIARAIALKPSLIIADEPISALDVSIQAQVVNLLQDLQEELDLTYLFISHDLNMVRHICHRVAVIYRGRIVEIASTGQLFENPLHPYTQVLLSAISVPDPVVERTRQHILMDPELDYGEPDSRLTEVSAGHWLATARCEVGQA